MNSSFKKFISVLLVVLIAASGAVSAFAADESLSEEPSTQTSEGITDNTGTQAPSDEETEDDDSELYTSDGEKIVARASLFAAMYVFPVSGHTWIYVENLTDEPIMVGVYEVPVDQGVSVGAFSFSVNDGWGIYYNLEAYRENRNDNIDDCRSLTIDLTEAELIELSESIKNYPNMWEMFIFNCTFFAFSIWNHNSDYFFVPFFLPAVAVLEVIIMGAKKGVTEMYYPTTDQVFKQRGTGKSAYLEPVGEKTLSK